MANIECLKCGATARVTVSSVSKYQVYVERMTQHSPCEHMGKCRPDECPNLEDRIYDEVDRVCGL